MKFRESFLIYITLILILLVASPVRPIPISNQIPSERSIDPDKIIYPDEIISDKDIKTTPACANNKETKLSATKKNPSDGLCGGGVRLAADVDQVNLTCYEVGTQGPCSSNMKFYTIPGNSESGMCDCDQDLPGIIYSNETKECHHLYRQEYCKEDYWLELSQGGPRCTPNTCVGNGTAQVLFNGNCVSLFAPCNNTRGEVGHIGFGPSNELSCLPSDVNYSITKAIPQLRCSEGTRWSNLTNTCKTAIKFTFD